MKRCPRCPGGQQWHPATEEYFHRNGDKLHTYCKVCRVQRKENPQKGGRPRKIREVSTEKKSVGRPRSSICTKCGEDDLSKFYYLNGKRKAICKKCDIKQKTEEHKRNPERHKARVENWREKNPHYGRQWAYGLSEQEYWQMLTVQNNTCRICKLPFDTKRKPHVDHCHATRKVRGLLCARCNHGLGQFKDNPAFLREAANYLEQ